LAAVIASAAKQSIHQHNALVFVASLPAMTGKMVDFSRVSSQALRRLYWF